MTGGDWVIWVFVAAAAWVLVALASRALMHSPRPGDLTAGLYYWAAVIYVRLMHRLRVEGRENIPAPGGAGKDGALIIVANHTAGIDPVLLQSALRDYEIRWMMAQDMMVRALTPLWEWMRIIAVVRNGGGRGDSTSAREALRHLKHGGVLGVFPEGGIEHPPRRLRPFVPGIGLLAAHSGATVLPIVITGTPYTPTAWGSFFRPSRTTLRILPPVRYTTKGLKPEEVAADLQRRFVEATGWEVGGLEESGADGGPPISASPRASS